MSVPVIPALIAVVLFSAFATEAFAQYRGEGRAPYSSQSRPYASAARSSEQSGNCPQVMGSNGLVQNPYGCF